jgi:hypothetical protein
MEYSGDIIKEDMMGWHVLHMVDRPHEGRPLTLELTGRLILKRILKKQNVGM